jgi:tetratricopeptide (TPR) repeat protein
VAPFLQAVSDKKAEDKEISPDPNTSILDVIELPQDIFIQGPPGAGKTTLLKYVLTNIIDLKIKKVPIFVSLLTFKAFYQGTPGYTLYHHLVRDLITYGFPEEFVRFILENGLAMILMDGFDETYIKEYEKKVLFTHLDDFKKTYDAKIVITSRNKDYNFSNTTFRYFEIMPFDDSQIDSFLNKQFKEHKKANFLDILNNFYNFTYAERNETDKPADDWAHDRIITMARHGLESEEVGNIFIKKRQLPQIASNPLFLSLLVFQFKESSTLSSKHVDLYQILVQHMVNNWLNSDASGYFKDRISNDSAFKMLYYVAFHTYIKGKNIITRQELFALVSRFIKEHDFESPPNPDDIIKAVRTDLGLITHYNGDEFRFIHLNIHEYLVAQHLAIENNYTIIFSDHLYLQKRWSPVIRLLTELLSSEKKYRSEYAKLTSSILHANPAICARVNLAIKKATLANGEICYGIVFYYLCIGLYYNVGERAIYACLRLAHEVLFRVYNRFRDDPMISLRTFAEELKYVGKVMENGNLEVDAIILQIYDKITSNNRSGNLDEFVVELEELAFSDSDGNLNNLKEEIKNENNEQCLYITNRLLESRNIIVNKVLNVEEVNLLTLFLDLLETFIEAAEEFGKSNFDYDIFFCSTHKYEIQFKVSAIWDFLTSLDYATLSDFYKVNRELCLTYISNAIKLNPSNAVYRFVRGASYSRFGYLEEALQDFRCVEILNTDYLENAYFQRCFGILYRRLNEFTLAIERFDRALQLEPEGNIQDRWLKAEVLMKAGEYETALILVSELRRISPSQSHFSYCLAYCSMLLNRFDMAIKYIKEAIRHRYCPMESHFILCYCELELGKAKKVSRSLSKYVYQSEEGLNLFYPLLLKAYKLQGDQENFKMLLEKTKARNMFPSIPSVICVPISPGHVELNRLNEPYFIEDFTLPGDYYL